MALVTAIERQKNHSGRYSIFLDDAYAWSLTDLELSLSGLRVGQSISPTQVEELRGQSEAGKAYQRALRFLSYRSRTTSEMTKYLAGRGFEQTIVNETLSRLGDQGLMDDRRFAADWIAGRQSAKPRSRRRLAQELKKKGLSEVEVEGALADVSQDDELENLKRIIEKKRHRYPDPRKLTQYLGGQGFDYDLIKQALKETEIDLGMAGSD